MLSAFCFIVSAGLIVLAVVGFIDGAGWVLAAGCLVLALVYDWLNHGQEGEEG